MKEERLYIVGYMASGKTTFGRALAEVTGRRFIDLDSLIEEAEGMPAGRVMAEKGEPYFRALESRLLRHTASERGAVIACGGGTPCYRDNMEFMTLHGQTLWIIASPERMAERILEAGDTRPLAAGKDRAELETFIATHLRRRQPYYCKAQWRLSGEHLENAEEIENAVASFMQTYELK